jgi:hypothetical protein
MGSMATSIYSHADGKPASGIAYAKGGFTKQGVPTCVCVFDLETGVKALALPQSAKSTGSIHVEVGRGTVMYKVSAAIPGTRHDRIPSASSHMCLISILIWTLQGPWLVRNGPSAKVEYIYCD